MPTYKERLQDDYNRIRTQVKEEDLPFPARNQAIDEAVSAYVLAQDSEFERKKASGSKPPIAFRDANMLDRFANLILHEDLTWSHPDKMSIVEYPVMSGVQERRRAEKATLHSELGYRDRQANGRVKRNYTDNQGGMRVSNNRLPFPMADDVYSDEETGIDVLTLLDNAGLTDRQREAVELCYFDELTQMQAAERMGVRQHTISEHVELALTKLSKSVNT